MNEQKRISDARKHGQADMAAFLLGITKDRPNALGQSTSAPNRASRPFWLDLCLAALVRSVRAAWLAAKSIGKYRKWIAMNAKLTVLEEIQAGRLAA